MNKNSPSVKCNQTTDDETAYIKSFMFLKGFAVAKNMEQTILALFLAQNFHEGQYRKDGLPYIIHPLKVATSLVMLGIDDDITIASALLHDIIEDCGEKLPLNGRELITEYGIKEEVITIIRILTKESGLGKHELALYFESIKKNEKASLIKLCDRLHNSSTLYTFPMNKMEKYINETNDFILPLASYCKKYYPAHTNTFSLLKTTINSINNSMKIMMQKLSAESSKEGLNNECSQN